MNNSLFKSAKLNAMTSYINFALNSILLFFINPYLVQYLGAYNFGIWKSVQKFLSFASIADGRSSQALKWLVANDEKNGDINKKQQAIGSSIRIWLYFLPILLVVIALLVYGTPLLINGINIKDYSLIRTVVFILGLNILFNPLFGIPDAVLVGINKGYKSTSIQTINMIVSNLLMIYVSYLGFGLIGLAFVVLGVTFLNGIFIFYICKKEAKWFGYQKADSEQIKNFLNFSVLVLVWSLITRLILSAEILLIGYYFNPEGVTNYVFSTYIIQLAIAVGLMTGSAIMPGLGKIIGEKNFVSASNIVKNSREITAFIAIFFGCFVLLMNRSFVTLWMGENYYIGDLNNFLTVIIAIQIIHFRNEGQIQDLSLKIKNKVIVGFLFTILSFILCALLVNFWAHKIEIIFMGIIIGRFGINILFKSMVDRMVNISQSSISKHLVCGLILITMYFIGLQINIDSWIYFLIISAVISIFLAVVSYFTVLSKVAQNLVLQLLKKSI
ncbi:oligosaccharide flippase family protein [Flavobacterium antarcticum]|uniref:oligosaccharide flippase family protein n=1 Tax=Flavobacterium antarcticum TaxID=271155 RepID=UPI0003B5FF5C|nr:oligosaccharide flippase family protein [Flavobacterium antarcticum]